MGDCQKGRNVSLRQQNSTQIRITQRTGYQELFLTAAPMPGQDLADLLLEMLQEIDARRASVVSHEIFGVDRQTGEAAFKRLAAERGDITWPVLWISEGADAIPPAVAVQIWAVTDLEVSPVHYNGRLIGVRYEDGSAEYCRLGGILPADISQKHGEQARSVFDQMEAGLENAGMNFHDVLRTWFYNDKITSWYAAFNEVRDTMFSRWHVFDGLVPASTAVGGANAFSAALTGGLIAVKAKTDSVLRQPLPSPLQCPALDYGSSFSRAVELETDDHRRVYVSGTASIAPEGHTVFIGDIEGQIAKTMEVIYAILESRGMDWKDVCRLIAYFKDAANLGLFPQYCEAQGISELPVAYVKDDICRDDLLFEVELDAIVAK